MSFIQTIDLHTSRFDEILTLDREWEQATEGRRTLRRSVVIHDRADPTHYVVLAFFDSYEDAMKNSALPETGRFAEQMAKLLDGPPQFVDYDVVEDRS